MSARETPLDGSAPGAGVPDPAPHVLVSASTGHGKGSVAIGLAAHLAAGRELTVADGKARRPRRPAPRPMDATEEIERCE